MPRINKDFQAYSITIHQHDSVVISFYPLVLFEAEFRVEPNTRFRTRYDRKVMNPGNQFKPSEDQKKLAADSPLQFMIGASCSTSFSSIASFRARNVEIKYL